MQNFLLASGEAILDVLEKAVSTWNTYMEQIVELLTTTPSEFKDGTIWTIIKSIYGSIEAIGISLLVLFFVMGMIKTCGSFTEVKKPEHALKLFVRFALAKGAVTYGLEIIDAFFSIGIGIIERITGNSLVTSLSTTIELPDEVTEAVSDLTLWKNFGTWVVGLIGSLVIAVLSIVMLITVYGRFFKIYIYTALAPIPLSAFAGQPTQSMGISYLKGLAAVILEGAVIALACAIFSAYTSSSLGLSFFNDTTSLGIVWNYLLEVIISLLVLVTVVKAADRIIKELLGLH